MNIVSNSLMILSLVCTVTSVTVIFLYTNSPAKTVYSNITGKA